MLLQPFTVCLHRDLQALAVCVRPVRKSSGSSWEQNCGGQRMEVCMWSFARAVVPCAPLCHLLCRGSFCAAKVPFFFLPARLSSGLSQQAPGLAEPFSNPWERE